MAKTEKLEYHLTPRMVEKIQAIDAEFQKMQQQLNGQLQLMLDCYVDALGLSDNQTWMLSADKKTIEVHEKENQQ